jgi:hypothetical protein
MDRAPGHVGAKRIDELYGRYMRTPEKEPLNLDAFFLQIIRLPKGSQALHGLPNPSQTVAAAFAGVPKAL